MRCGDGCCRNDDCCVVVVVVWIRLFCGDALCSCVCVAARFFFHVKRDTIWLERWWQCRSQPRKLAVTTCSVVLMTKDTGLAIYILSALHIRWDKEVQPKTACHVLYSLSSFSRNNNTLVLIQYTSHVLFCYRTNTYLSAPFLPLLLVRSSNNHVVGSVRIVCHPDLAFGLSFPRQSQGNTLGPCSL